MASGAYKGVAAGFSRGFDLNLIADEGGVDAPFDSFVILNSGLVGNEGGENGAVGNDRDGVAAGVNRYTAQRFDLGGENVQGFVSREASKDSMGYGGKSNVGDGLGAGISERNFVVANMEGIVSGNGGFRIRELGFSKNRGEGRSAKTDTAEIRNAIGRVDKEIAVHRGMSVDTGLSEVGAVGCGVRVEGATPLKTGRGESATTETLDSCGGIAEKVVFNADETDTTGSSVIGSVVADVDSVVQVAGETPKRKGRGRPRKSAPTKTQGGIFKLDDKVVFNADITNAVDAVDGVVQAEEETPNRKGRGRHPKFAALNSLESIGKFADDVIVYANVNNDNGPSIARNVVDAVDGVVQAEGENPKRKGRGRRPKFAALSSLGLESIGKFADDVIVYGKENNENGLSIAGNVVDAVDGAVQAEGEAPKTKGRGSHPKSAALKSPKSIGKFADDVIVYGNENNENGPSIAGNEVGSVTSVDGIALVEGETVKKKGRGRPRKSTTTETTNLTGRLDDKVILNADLTNEIRSGVIDNVVDFQLEGETSMNEGGGRSPKSPIAKTSDSIGKFADVVVDYGDLNNEFGSNVIGDGVADVDYNALAEEETSKKRGRGRPRKSTPTKTPDGISRLDYEVMFSADITHENCSTVTLNTVGVIDCVAQVERERTKKKGRGRPPKSATMKTPDCIVGLDDKVVFSADVSHEICSSVIDNVLGTVDSVVQVEEKTAKKKGMGRPLRSAAIKAAHRIVKFALEDYGDVNNEICSGFVDNGVVAADGVVLVEEGTSKKRGRGRPPKSVTAKTPVRIDGLDDKVDCNADLTSDIEPSSVMSNVCGIVDGAIQDEEEATTKKRTERSPKSATVIKTPDSIGKCADEVVVHGDLNNEIGSSVGDNEIGASDGDKRSRGRPLKSVTVKTSDGSGRFHEEVVKEDASCVFGTGFDGNVVRVTNGIVEVNEEEIRKNDTGCHLKSATPKAQDGNAIFHEQVVVIEGITDEIDLVVVGNIVSGADAVVPVEEDESCKKRRRGRPPKSASTKTKGSNGRFDVMVNKDASEDILSIVDANDINAADDVQVVDDGTPRKRGRGRLPKLATNTQDKSLHAVVPGNLEKRKRRGSNRFTFEVYECDSDDNEQLGVSERKSNSVYSTRKKLAKVGEHTSHFPGQMVGSSMLISDGEILKKSSTKRNSTAFCIRDHLSGAQTSRATNAEYSAPNELLLDLCLVATDPLNEHALLNRTVDYFRDFRNWLTVSAKDEIPEDLSGNKTGRKLTELKSSSSGLANIITSCVQDSYGNEDKGKAEPLTIKNGKRKVFQEAISLSDPSSPMLSSQGAIQLEPERPLIRLQEAEDSPISESQNGKGESMSIKNGKREVVQEAVSIYYPSSPGTIQLEPERPLIRLQEEAKESPISEGQKWKGESTSIKSRKRKVIQEAVSISDPSSAMLSGPGAIQLQLEPERPLIRLQEETEESPISEGQIGKKESTSIENGKKKVVQEVVSVSDPSSPMLSSPRAIQSESERPLISLLEEAEESIPTELILVFGDSYVVPSVADLVKIFGQYGPLRDTETHIIQSLKIAKIVFKKHVDAVVAEAVLRGAGEESLFGQACIGYKLHPIGPILSNPGAVQHLEPKRFLIELQDEECIPTELVLAFVDSCALPTVADLVQIFGKYGPLREADTLVVENIKVARVVFKRRVDADAAELALSTAGRYSFFQQASLAGHKLRNLESVHHNFSLQQ